MCFREVSMCFREVMLKGWSWLSGGCVGVGLTVLLAGGRMLGKQKYLIQRRL